MIPDLRPRAEAPPNNPGDDDRHEDAARGEQMRAIPAFQKLAAIVNPNTNPEVAPAPEEQKKFDAARVDGMRSNSRFKEFVAAVGTMCPATNTRSRTR